MKELEEKFSFFLYLKETGPPFPALITLKQPWRSERRVNKCGNLGSSRTVKEININHRVTLPWYLPYHL